MRLFQWLAPGAVRVGCLRLCDVAGLQPLLSVGDSKAVRPISLVRSIKKEKASMKPHVLILLIVSRAVVALTLLMGVSAHASFSATSDPTICTVAPCYTYSHHVVAYDGTQFGTGPMPSRQAACEALAVIGTQSNQHSPFVQGYTQRNPRLIGNNCWTDAHNAQGTFVISSDGGAASQTSVAPSAPSYSCPDPTSATLSGSSCTCKADYLQNAYNNGCTPGGDGGTVVNNSRATKVSSCPWCVANPIYPLIGGKVEPVVTGLSVGGQPLVFTYSSAKQLAAVAAGKTAKTFGNMPSLGGLWESSLHRNLVLGTGGFGATLHRGDGQTVSFRYSGGVYIADADVNGTFTAISGGYRYVDAKARTIETYNAAGQLTGWADTAGNTLTFSYSTAAGATAPTAGYLQNITDNNGRSLSFVYSLPAGGAAATDGLISSVADSMSRTISTTFDANGNLTQLTWPDTKTRQFVYENASLPWALTGVIDERSIRYSTFAYDSAGRALSSEHAGGVDKYSVSYSTPPQVAVTQTYDPATQLTTRTHDWQSPTGVQLTRPNGEIVNAGSSNVLGYPLPTGFSQPAGSGYGASNNASTFDANGNLTSTDDFSGQRSCYAYDSSNRETVRVEGLATTVDCASVLPGGSTLPTGSRKTETSWHPDWRLPVKVSQPLLNTSTVYHGQPDPFNGNTVANCTTAPVLPNGKPMPLACKQVEQVTLSSGAIDPAVPASTTAFTYDAVGRILSKTDANSRTSSFVYYTDTTIPSYTQAPGTFDQDMSAVSMLLHGDGANGSTSITDSSLSPRAVSVVGSTQISTAQAKFGQSILFNGASHLTAPDAVSPALGNGDFTIEAWIRPTSTFGIYGGNRFAVIASKDAAAGRSWWFRLYADASKINNIQFALTADGGGFDASTGPISGAVTIPFNQWTHVAATRGGGFLRTFVNGLLLNQTASTTVIQATATPVTIGGQGWPTSEAYFPGYIDDLRITKGLARYTANFTPPSQAFPDVGQIIGNPTDVGHTTGDLKSITNAAGHATQFTLYDRAGRVRQMVDPKGIVTDTLYTPRGWTSSVTITPPGGTARTTSYAYDNAGQLTGVTLPDATTMSYSFDAAHRLTGVTDARGNSVTYSLDNAGNKTSEQVRDLSGTLQRNITRVYDALNRVQQVKGASN